MGFTNHTTPPGFGSSNIIFYNPIIPPGLQIFYKELTFIPDGQLAKDFPCIENIFTDHKDPITRILPPAVRHIVSI